MCNEIINNGDEFLQLNFKKFFLNLVQKQLERNLSASYEINIIVFVPIDIWCSK